MPVSLPEAIAQIAAQCQAGLGGICQAIERAFGEAVEATVAEPISFDAAHLPDDLAGPGLAMGFVGGEGIGIFLLPESSGFVPAWYTGPDASQQTLLSALAKELGSSLLPAVLTATDIQFRAVPSLAEVVRQAKPSDGAKAIQFSLKTKSQLATARFLWPVAGTGLSIADEAAATSPAALAASAQATDHLAHSMSDESEHAIHLSHSVAELPQYTRSLLHIRVPISVTLATKRQPIAQILDLGAGSIIHFDKSCEEMLDLFVGEHRVAKGEAVKVGEKFGLRITSVILPDERFESVNRD